MAKTWLAIPGWERGFEITGEPEKDETYFAFVKGDGSTVTPIWSEVRCTPHTPISHRISMRVTV